MNDEAIERAIQSSLKESCELHSTIKDTCIEGIEEAAVEICCCLENDGKILLFGKVILKTMAVLIIVAVA